MTIQVQEQEYALPQKWEDVTLRKWIAFSKEIAPKEPECMFDGTLDETKYLAEALPYMCRYIEFWGDMPEGLAIKCRHDQLAGLYRSVSQSLAILPVPDEKPVLHHAGELWHLPEKAFEGSTVQDFIEAAQYQDMAEKLGLGQWGVLPKLMCILVRKEGEPYSEELMRREAQFLEWPMHHVFQVSFFLRKLGQTYLQSSLSLDVAQNLSSLRLVLADYQKTSAGTHF